MAKSAPGGRLGRICQAISISAQVKPKSRFGAMSRNEGNCSSALSATPKSILQDRESWLQ
jgi:hypothetical protein